jgi:methyl-accepting chemotaxis protein
MKLNLTPRFVLILLSVGLLPLLILAFVSLRSADSIGTGLSFKLRSGAETTLEIIERNLFERYGDVQAFCSNSVVRQYPLGTPESTAVLVPAINIYVRLYGCYPLSLITDAQGKVVAVNTADATGKAIDTAFLLGKDFSQASWFTSTREGRFLKSDLLDGTVVEDVMQDADVAKATGNSMLTVSYSAPITDAAGKFIGVWHNYADFALVETMLQQRYEALNQEGLSTTEVTLINRKGLLLAEYDPSATGKSEFTRNPATVLKANLIQQGVESATGAITGKSGDVHEFNKAKKVNMVTGYAQSKGALGYAGLGWSMLIRVPEADLLAEVNSSKFKTYSLVGISAVLLLVVAFAVARSITKPIHACVTAMERLAQGDLTAQIDLKRTDELGTLGNSINASITTLRQLIGSLTQSITDLQRSAATLTDAAHTQASASEETTVQSNTVAAAGEQLSVNAKSMSAAATQITQSTSTVAAAMEEMSSSIQEVARNCAQENTIARQADAQARQTRELMGKLDESARQIGKVVELINRIAEQTNLLALNATIEAASAGEAGRGFAVVANEVKELARQSASATEDIRKQVELIQANTGASMKSLEQVGTIIEQVTQISSSVASAVAQQSATTSEIVGTIHGVSTATGTLSQNVQQTADGAADVARNIAGVSTAAADGARGAALVSTSANELTALSTTLSQLVSKFKV